jgi:hypothetical protein
MSDWREQYERMKRWRETIARDRIDHDRVQDIFLAFVQTCYHMVDWLHRDPSQPIRKGDAKKYVFASDALSLCGDLCIGAKHALLEGRLKENKADLTVGTSVIGAYTLHTGRREVSVAKLQLEWRGASIPALEFADRCIAEWDRLLAQHRLLASS